MTLEEKRELVQKMIVHEAAHMAILSEGRPLGFPHELIVRGEIAACTARVRQYQAWLDNNPGG